MGDLMAGSLIEGSLGRTSLSGLATVLAGQLQGCWARVPDGRGPPGLWALGFAEGPSRVLVAHVIS